MKTSLRHKQLEPRPQLKLKNSGGMCVVCSDKKVMINLFAASCRLPHSPQMFPSNYYLDSVSVSKFPNDCNGHGACGAHDRCYCINGINGRPASNNPHCSGRTCPSEVSFVCAVVAENNGSAQTKEYVIAQVVSVLASWDSRVRPANEHCVHISAA